MSLHDSDEIAYVPPAVGDREALRAMARQSFTDTFADRYATEPFVEFLDRAYGPDGVMAADLADPSIRWLSAFYQAEPVGYAKLTPLRAPATDPQPGAVELQQIYVLKAWHGRGVAANLMQWAIDTARDLRAPEIYLTVFDDNERAKRFYRRRGFAEVGHCTFTLGDRDDDDRIWRRNLIGEPTIQTGAPVPAAARSIPPA